MKKKYYYVYQITNLINGKIYVGAHQTQNINDEYMGSGAGLQRAYTKYGINNFKKKILKFFNSREDMLKGEAQIVDIDFIKKENVYNLKIGGGNGSWNPTIGKVVVKDKEGNTFQVSVNDERFLNGKLVGVNKGITFEGIKGVITVKDSKGFIFRTSVTDPRFLNQELVGINKGVSIHTKEFKKETSQRNSKAQKGKGNSQYGKMWITDGNTSKKIMKDDKIPIGWKKGRDKNCNKN